MKSVFPSPHRYEKRLSYPIVSAYMKNRDRHIRNFLSRGNGSLLDLGCGTGYYLNGSSENFSKILAVDSSSQMLKIFSKNNSSKKISALRANALKISARKEFDNVICIGLLNYFSEKDAQKLIEKIYSLAKTGGRVLLAAPSSEKLSGHAYKAIWRAHGTKINLYSKKFLLEKMRATGFKKIKIKNAKDFPTFHIILEASK